MTAFEIEELRLKITTAEAHLAQLKSDLRALESSPSNVTSELSSSIASSQEDLESRRWPLLGEEYRRYGRQMILPEIGLQGQLKLRGASVLIVGVGGLGCPAAAYLAGAGVGTLGLMDGDTVEVSNLHRQILHSTQSVGLPKVESARESLYRTHAQHLDPVTSLEIMKKYDLVLDCTDHPTSRYLISDAAVLASIPLISASALRTDGQLLVLNAPTYNSGSSARGPCYRCVFPKPPPAESVVSCGEGGVLGPVVGVMGVLMALEAIKTITARRSTGSEGVEQPALLPSTLQASLLIFSAKSQPPFRNVRLRGKRADCISCSSQATITPGMLTSGALDYAVFCGLTMPVRLLEKAERITAKMLQVIRQEGKPHVVVDVRDEAQFGICNLQGSINIPMHIIQASHTPDSASTSYIPGFDRGKLLEEIGKTIPEETDILVVCRFGNDSQLAVKKMQEIGLGCGGKRQIQDVAGGFQAWRDEVDQSWPEY